MWDRRDRAGFFNEGSMSKLNRVNSKERRSSRRILASEAIPQAVTRLASGQRVELINIGLNGSILINSAIVLSPGSYIRLRMTISNALMTLEGRVVRCRVVGLKQAKIQYEAAVVLDEGLPPLLARALEVPEAEDSPADSPSLQEANPDTMVLPSTAELWILGAQEA